MKIQIVQIFVRKTCMCNCFGLKINVLKKKTVQQQENNRDNFGQLRVGQTNSAYLWRQTYRLISSTKETPDFDSTSDSKK